MSMSKRLGVLLIAGVVVIFGAELGDRFVHPGSSQRDPECRSPCWSSTHACQRCRRGTTHGATLRGRRIQLLVLRPPIGRPFIERER